MPTLAIAPPRSSSVVSPIIILCASLGIFVVLLLVLTAPRDVDNLTQVIAKNITNFRTAFYMLAIFMGVFLVILLIRMDAFGQLARALCFAGIVIIAIDVVLMFAVIYLASGLIKNGNMVTPSAFEAAYFSVLVFTGNGWGEFMPLEEMRDMVMFEAALSFTFTPVLISSLFLMLQPSHAYYPR